MRIESAVGEGTTVRVLLPCTDQQPVTAPPDKAESSATRRPGPLKIVLVDDDHDLRGVLVSALQSHGHLVVEAQDGPTALSALDALITDPPDIVVADFAMPGMTGAEMAERIAARWPDMPLLFVSGFADTDAIEAAVGGEARMLRKPFRVEELLRAIDEVLG